MFAVDVLESPRLKVDNGAGDIVVAYIGPDRRLFCLDASVKYINRTIDRQRETPRMNKPTSVKILTGCSHQ